MKTEHEYPTIRKLLGPGLLLMVVLVAGAFLEAAADDGPETWLLRAFLIISIFAVAGYLFLVYLPERNLERRLKEVESRYTAQCAAIEKSMAELRYGDLVSPRRRRASRPRRSAPPWRRRSSDLRRCR